MIIEAIFRGKWALNAFHKNAKKERTVVANFMRLYRVMLGRVAKLRAKFGGFCSSPSENIDPNVYFTVFARNLY